VAKSFANRFVAGETVDTALAAVTRLNARGITASLDLLGESVHNDAEARAAGEAYLSMLDRIHRQKADATYQSSSRHGLDISEDLCVANMQKIFSARATVARSCASTWSRGIHSTHARSVRARLYPAYRENWGSCPIAVSLTDTLASAFCLWIRSSMLRYASPAARASRVVVDALAQKIERCRDATSV